MGEKILIIDKDKKLSDFYFKELQQDGFDVHTVKDGKEAVDKFHQQPADVVVMELEIPGIPGLDCLQRFIEKKRDVKIIIHTEHPEYKLNFKTWAADVFMTKVENPLPLKRKIHEVLHR